MKKWFTALLLFTLVGCGVLFGRSRDSKLESRIDRGAFHVDTNTTLPPATDTHLPPVDAHVPTIPEAHSRVVTKRSTHSSKRPWDEQMHSIMSDGQRLPITLFAIAMPEELPTLENALQSWERHGLLGMVQERLFWMQGTSEIMRNLMVSSGFRVFGGKNVNIAQAIENLLPHMSARFVLILEKDWVLIEPMQETWQQLQDGVQAIDSGDTDVVRYRSHFQFGYPMWMFSIIGVRNEQYFAKKYPQMLQYFCNCFHWYTMQEMQQKYPKVFRFCGANASLICVDSSSCNWTNNPALFLASFWAKQMSPVAQQCGPGESNRCFEVTLDTKDETWKTKKITVAFTEGLFQHVDPQKYGNKTQADHQYHGRRVEGGKKGKKDQKGKKH